MDPAIELVEVLDEEDRVVCVHKRTDTKDVYPGFYDVIAGGMNGIGETYDVCAARELEGELGITARPAFRFKHRYEGPDGRCWAVCSTWSGTGRSAGSRPRSRGASS